jgi:T6SS, Phospholipase effector Tle1-like, catalytic domain
MALYAFDGTGDDDTDRASRDSNVLDFFRAYDGGPKNEDPSLRIGSLYLKGIGNRARSFVGDRPAEAFGVGGHRRVRQAIDRLENNFETGDSVVDVIGFSRGAALAVSFANELAGKLPRVIIRFMGLWDMVGQFGAPGRRFNAGHDLGMPPNVMRCYHAMALDETRLAFPLTRLSETDPDNGHRGMNWISLNWLFENARRDGLPITRTAILANAADGRLPQQISSHDARDHCRTILTTDLLHTSVGLDGGNTERLNNPTSPLARIDDAGRVQEAV